MRTCALLVCALALTACEGGTTEPSFGAPAAVTITAGADQSAVAGSAVSVAPRVRVTDADGRPVPGIPVPFTVTAGGGTVVGSPATTDADGVAALTSWTLGTTAGTNALTAGVSGIASVTFTATGTAGTAAAVTRVEGDAQSAGAGLAVTTRPAVKVADAHGNAIAGVNVTFAVTAGGGTITGATAATDAQGVARVGSWTLGAVGQNTLSATVAGLPPVTFTATATDPCAVSPITIGGTVNGSIASSDCLDTQYNVPSDRYTFTLAAQTSFTLNISSATVRAGVQLDGAAPILRTYMAAANTPREVRFALPAGTYSLRALPYTAAETGAYALATTAGIGNGCANTYIARGISVSGSLTSQDCVSIFTNQHYYDNYVVYMRVGDSFTANAAGSGQLLIDVLAGSTSLVTSGQPSSNETVSFTAQQEGYISISVVNLTSAFATGAYTLSVQ